MSHMLTDLKKIHALMFKVLKSIYIFESTNRYLFMNIFVLIFHFKQVQSRVYHGMLCNFLFFSCQSQ